MRPIKPIESPGLLHILTPVHADAYYFGTALCRFRLPVSFFPRSYCIRLPNNHWRGEPSPHPRVVVRTSVSTPDVMRTCADPRPTSDFSVFRFRRLHLEALFLTCVSSLPSK